MRLKLIVAALLVTAALLMAPAPVFTLAPDSPVSSSVDSRQKAAVIENKNEVIYATLASDGTINAVYAVNHFEVSQSGSIKDYGNYASVVNLTSTGSLNHNNEFVYFETDRENFYYQGNMATTDLPWEFHISYYLDGVKTPLQD